MSSIYITCLKCPSFQKTLSLIKSNPLGNFQPPEMEGLTYAEVEIITFAGCKPQKRPAVKEDLESTEYADIDVTKRGRRHEEKTE